ncbi:RidA family protein [Beijerinckia sp. L45]|uniref:RidA family protein n=1 Tax=Beijerinckia sp. L45 TaxID=1641855 RepID=UPI00131BF0BB|nr:RidA family protein [Beijerinckia sp. L45]
MTRLVNPPALKAQSYYNHAVVKAGTPVFLTGQVAWDGDGIIVGPGDIAAQIAQTWRNIDALVTEIGATRQDIVKLVTYATSRDFLPALHAERGRFFGDGPYPASTFILVAGLAEPDLLVEIDVTVMLPHGAA